MPNNLTIASLYYELQALKGVVSDQAETINEQAVEIRSLKKWRDHCTLVAAGWGGICMAVFTIGGVIHSNWEWIKNYMAGQK